MWTDQQLLQQIPFVLSKTNLPFLGERYEGKVRDNYTHGDERYLITTDRLSCFDVVVTTIPFKGQVLTEMAGFWLERAKEIVPTHVIAIPDPNVMLVRNCEVLPVEVIVRAYLAGSAQRDYAAGKAISGVMLPPGLRPSEKLPELLITPSTKAAKGSHDLPVSEAEILSRRLVEPALWEQIREVSLALFQMGSDFATQRGLLMVDTKYEFGLYRGTLVLVDEIHTLDCSRYWVEATYQERFMRGETPEMLDKEPMRQWLLSKGYQGEGSIPEFTDDHRVSIARHYVSSFERITGLEFQAQVGSVEDRIIKKLQH